MPNENKISLCESCENCMKVTAKQLMSFSNSTSSIKMCVKAYDIKGVIVTECTHFKEKDNG